MFAACTYEEIEAEERKIENKEIVVLLFVRATKEDILNEFEYLHFNSGKYCSIYAIGYINDFTKGNNKAYKKVDVYTNGGWYFNTKAFVDFKEKLQDRINWNYSGETEIIVLQNNPGKTRVLNFENYVAINIDKGIREGYIDSFQAFMESLIRYSKSEVTARELIHKVRNSRISIKGILEGAIEECQKVPTPIKTIMKDRLFYRSANTIKAT